MITAIIVRDGKFLITKRSANKKRFPNRWTIPGGHLEIKDYIDLPKDTEDYWYNVLERTLVREVKEEVGLTIKNVRYLTSLATIHDEKSQVLILSCLADYESGEVRLQEEETDDFSWVSLDDAKKYDLIDGIYDELEMADRKLKGEKVAWKRF